MSKEKRNEQVLSGIGPTQCKPISFVDNTLLSYYVVNKYVVKCLVMIIRRAEEKDIDQILKLLSQVLEVHYKLRPDLFISGTTKYTKNELTQIIDNDRKTIFVAVEDNKVLGYVFCEIDDFPKRNAMIAYKSLYIDDLCVDESERGNGIGKQLFEYAKEFAKEIDCLEIELHVWEGNDSAKTFYERMGLKQKYYSMEYKLED